MEDDEIPDVVEFYVDGFVKTNPGILIAYDADLAVQNVVKIPPMAAELANKMEKQEDEIVIITAFGDYIIYFESIRLEIFMVFFPVNTSDADILKVLPSPVMLPYINQAKDQLCKADGIEFPKVKFNSGGSVPHLEAPEN